MKKLTKTLQTVQDYWQVILPKEQKRISIEIKKLQDEKTKLEEDYLIEHWEFQPGDAVRLIYKDKEEKVFVSSCRADISGNKHYVWYSEGDYKMELINSEYRTKNFDGSPLEVT